MASQHGILFLIALLLCGCLQSDEDTGTDTADTSTDKEATGDQPFAGVVPPAFIKVTITDWNNQHVDLGELRGDQPALVVFIGATCPYCAAFLELIAEHWATFEGRLVFMIISLDDSTTTKLQHLRNKFPFTFYIDNREILAEKYGYIGQVPYTVFINRHGKLIRREVGFTEENGPIFLRLFEEVIADDTPL